jgi:hypothetical protein
MEMTTGAEQALLILKRGYMKQMTNASVEIRNQEEELL